MVLHPTEIANELKGFPFFRGFPIEALLTFSTMAVSVEFAPGQYLLMQGKNNDNLFFLRKGQLAIEVDGEKISELEEPGEVFGEMSLINRRPVAASVRAINHVEVFKVSESHLVGLPAKDQQNFQQLLYRVYATVLADRLTKTNDKAKRFEIAHRELEAAHENLRKVNQDLEGEINRRSKEIVTKIRDLTESHLQPTQIKLSNWSRGVETVEMQDINKLLRSVSEVVDFLKPMTDLAQKGQQSVSSKKVLLCDMNKKQQTIAKLALGGTGVQLSLASTAEELESGLKNEKFDLILCDAELGKSAQSILQENQKTPVALLVNLDMNFYLQTLKDFPEHNFFVSRDVNNRTFTIKNIATTVSKILNQDFFGMDKYLSWGASYVEKVVNDSNKRLELIEEMKEHFKSFGIRSAILDRVHTVCEELLMNAIYDAPTDKSGKPLFNHLPRTEKIILSKDLESQLRYCTDGMLLAVSVTDPFGALSKEIIMKYLESCYSGQAGTLNVHKGGAGRGLHMLIESADLTIINVKKSQKTEFISLFNLEKNKDEDAKPTFHLFFN